MIRRSLLIFILLSGCSEYGKVSVSLCPPCADAYSGFHKCAFFDADSEWARPEMLVDDQNFIGVGTSIEQDGYMHHKFCFNKTHAVFGSANPTRTGLLSNDNYVIHIKSNYLAAAFKSEYEYLKEEGNGKHKKKWKHNGKDFEILFCPRDMCEERVLEVLGEANNSIKFLSFSLTSDAVGDALVAAQYRGVNVQGIMENLGAHGLGSEYDRLKEAGVDVRIANTPGLMHAKAIIADDVAIVGSYNPSKNANTKNAETLVVMRENEVVEELERLFLRITTNK